MRPWATIVRQINQILQIIILNCAFQIWYLNIDIHLEYNWKSQFSIIIYKIWFIARTVDPRLALAIRLQHHEQLFMVFNRSPLQISVTKIGGKNPDLRFSYLYYKIYRTIAPQSTNRHWSICNYVTESKKLICLTISCE